MAYDAFISYSHGADARLAPVLQSALQRFAKPWWKLRALNLFRDETSLAAASSLSGAILKALDGARYFILLASPRAAQSKWCRAEVAHWLGRSTPETLLIVLSEGTILWDDDAGDFDWAKTDALPPDTLKGVFKSEPFYLDLAWAKSAEQLEAREPRFQSVVAKLAATLHGKSLEEISGEELRQHRRTRRVAAAAVASIGVLAVGASGAAIVAYEAREAAEASAAEARRERDIAEKARAEAERQKQAAERSLAEALDAADTLVFELAAGLKDFEGVPIERIKSVLEKAESIFARLDTANATAEVRHRRAVMLQVFCAAYLDLGQTGEAMARATAMRKLMEALAEKDPSNTRKQRDLAVSHIMVGHVLVQQGDLAGALAAYRASLAIAERFARQDPRNSAWQLELSVSHNKVGDVLLDQGDLTGALASYRASLAIRERLAEQDPRNAGERRNLSVSYDKVGDVLVAQGNLTGALAVYRESLVIRERLAQQDPRNASWQRDLVVSQIKVGDVLLAQGELAAAHAAYRASLAIAERLAQQDPRNAGWQRDLFVSHTKIGAVQARQNDYAAAHQSYRAGLAIIERLLAARPDHPQWLRDRAWVVEAIAKAETAAKRAAE